MNLQALNGMQGIGTTPNGFNIPSSKSIMSYAAMIGEGYASTTNDMIGGLQGQAKGKAIGGIAGGGLGTILGGVLGTITLMGTLISKLL